MSTTAQRLRSFWGDRQLNRGGLSSLILRYWYVALIIAVIELAARLRLSDLGDRAVHHDESIHVKFAYDITRFGPDAYTHDPVYHGPFSYFGNAVIFKVFGVSDYTSRLFPALI